MKSSAELIEMVANYREWKRMKEDAENEFERIKKEIANEMEERGKDVLKGDNFKITYKMIHSSNFDRKGLREESPELEAKYTIPNDYKRLTVA